jgi:hypothetical protein
MKDEPAMQYTDNVAAHVLVIMLSVAIAFLGLMMLAQPTRSDLHATHNIAPKAGSHSVGQSDEQNNLNQRPIKVHSAGEVRAWLGSQAPTRCNSVHAHGQLACPLCRPGRNPSAMAISVHT